jgi:pSer/pThr/pTyr-binding forkhead associated (FHA) protein
MKVSLLVLNGKRRGLEIKLPASQFVIGRDERCHLRPTSTDVSRCHCAIGRHGQMVQVCDLKSANGTYLNGKRIVGITRAHNGDVLSVGPLRFQFQIESKPAVQPSDAAPGLDWLMRDADSDEKQALDPAQDTSISLPPYTDEPVAQKRPVPEDSGNYSALGGRYLREYLFRRRQQRQRAQEDPGKIEPPSA